MNFDLLTEKLQNSRHIAFFGGAGVSTESGLKDYRSKDGIYQTAKTYGKPPEVILSHTCFMQETELFYRFYRDYFVGTDRSAAMPNRAHIALAELEKKGKRVSVITQNIDGLHQAAGSTEVYELHGTIATYHCVGCTKEYGIEAVRAYRETVPKCTCGCVIKPDVVLYEEMLDDSTVSGAIQAIQKADLLIIGGTSMTVQPAASFVRYFQGNTIVIINRDATAYDDMADLVYREPIGEVLGEAVARLL